ncbi:MAG: polyprenyl synthetase family protein [Candidatus Melainabacteria bacterium]|nr:polyprenyl synthetase family protein [Candidatus Melainabacteria bacterium]MBI3309294.1 polyprenyl synthetase family protein [Candidatus Melainabacteria bacterium]
MKQAIIKKTFEARATRPEFLTYIQDELKLVEQKLYSNIPQKDNLLSEIISYILKAGGKRIRPSLSLLIAKGTGQVIKKHIILAELTELIHTASLIHDDIIDSSLLRRGRETINSLWNNKVSVIAGDYLFAQASVRLGEIENNEIVKIYAKVLSDLCCGEIEQFVNKFKTNISWNYYIDKSMSKTGSLFAAACKGAAILNELSVSEIELANNYGRCVGIAFQIKDDLLDFTSSAEELGKESCSDLKNGLITAPTLFALTSEDSRKEQLKQLIESEFKTDHENYDKAIRLVHELGGCEKAEELADKYIREAKNSLSFIKDNVIKEHLSTAADFIVKR